MQIGVVLANEIQSLVFANVAGGTFTLALDGSVTPAIDYIFDPTSQAAAIQAGLRNLPHASQVVVTVVVANSYLIEWQGLEQNKKYSLLTVHDNNLIQNVPPSPALVMIEEVQAGSPINAITVDTGAVTTPPTGVGFVDTDIDTPIVVGTLKSLEGFAIWVQRTTDPETTPIANDGFTLKTTGDRVVGGVGA